MKSLILTGFLLFCASYLPVQGQSHKVRLAQLVIDSIHLEDYKALLKEEIEASLALEPGVLTLYAVSEKDRPNRFTILEIYASESAYQSHLKTEHFLKYKNKTVSMVQSLELIETIPLLPLMKIKSE
ncbi:putative quinol monooxygenase [Marinoscillum sp. 108]|nr:putative quinol monooxygenase [Marinoscillum sp. 108]VXD11659.1 Antibiotic biosynthesis monooxygenase [Marinoscillum sp. 108]